MPTPYVHFISTGAFIVQGLTAAIVARKILGALDEAICHVMQCSALNEAPAASRAPRV